MELERVKHGMTMPQLSTQPDWLRKLIAHRQLVLAIAGGVFLLAGYLAGLGDEPGQAAAATVFYVLSYGIGGFYKAKEGLEDIIHNRTLNVEILMIAAALGAVSIGYWHEGAVLIFIFSLSGALETYTWQKSKKDLSKLMEMAPLEASRLDDDGRLAAVSVEELAVGDLILIRNGEAVPADGIVSRGTTSIDESAITGESVPAEKSVGDYVFNGTLNGRGSLVVEVTKENNDSLFQKMIRLVEQAKASRPPAQQFIEKVEGPYVIIVLAAVALMLTVPSFVFGAPFQETFYRAMVLLVVASPCAVVASVMPALLSAVSNGARGGVLMKGGTYLEQLSKSAVVAFDKTGTITRGEPAVTDFFTLDASDRDNMLTAVMAVEQQSSHPLAKAVVDYCFKEGVNSPADVHTIEDVTGYGVKALVGENYWRIGNREMMRNGSDSITVPPRIEECRMVWQKQGKTVVYIGKNSTVAGLLAIKDEIRPEAEKLIDDLNSLGIKTVMITGDHDTTAASIAGEVGIHKWISRCLPEQKVTEVEKLKQQYGSVVMVGDGVNDAPAMAKADVGIAMGSGTDVAIDTADIVLMKSELEKISSSFRLSRRLNRIVVQNLVFSVSVILLLITATFAQQLSLPLGVIGHEGSTILVILNGLRLLR